MNTNQATTSHERAVSAASGWVMLPTLIVLFVGDVALIIFAIKNGVETTGQPHFGLLIPSCASAGPQRNVIRGLLPLQNEARAGSLRRLPRYRSHQRIRGNLFIPTGLGLWGSSPRLRRCKANLLA
jgi:hypothetical protein